jgi:hypothetical protein
MPMSDEKRRAWRVALHGDAIRDTPSPVGQVVLDELRAYCFGGFSTAAWDNGGRVDPSATLINEGRRQVWIFVQARLAPERETVDDEQHSDSGE